MFELIDIQGKGNAAAAANNNAATTATTDCN